MHTATVVRHGPVCLLLTRLVQRRLPACYFLRYPAVDLPPTAASSALAAAGYCPHRATHFLPWHRAEMLELERVRGGAGEVADCWCGCLLGWPRVDALRVMHDWLPLLLLLQ